MLETIYSSRFAERREYSRILFVGCDWYTRGYRRLFPRSEYWTLEIDPEKARYGSSRHIVDEFENVGAHFAAGELDLVLCNNVFGWGLNARPAVERAIRGAHECPRWRDSGYRLERPSRA